MASEVPRALVEINYYHAAQEYLRKLPLEHFTEATTQATQREITLASLALVTAARPDVHVFNELLVQYPWPRRKRPGQVVPDNMVVVYAGKIDAEGSYDIPLQPVGPFWMLEYVSKSNKRKDYEDNREKYEKHLKVPYYLLFYPEVQELTLFHYTNDRFVSVKPNEHGRLAIPQLELEVALLDEWARYWFRGKLLPLPADLQRERDEARRKLQTAEEEVARLRAELEQLRRQQKPD
jgi:Uma2 family endonuclease